MASQGAAAAKSLLLGGCSTNSHTFPRYHPFQELHSLSLSKRSHLSSHLTLSVSSRSPATTLVASSKKPNTFVTRCSTEVAESVEDAVPIEKNQELLHKPVCRRFIPQMATADSTVSSSKLGSDSSEHGDKIENARCDIETLHEKPKVDGFEDKDDETEVPTDQQMVKVSDKLIDVFMVDKPRTTDWRMLLAFSKEWGSIRAHFFKRCQERADAEIEPSMKQALFRLGRKLKEVDEDVQRHNELIDAAKKASPDISGLIARRRKDFTREFFEHLHAVAESYCDSPIEHKDMVELLSNCLAAVEAHDNASESIAALDAAELKFNDIINSPTLGDACRKIDDLAEKKQLDSALMLMLTKAWSASKDSNLATNEAKDILYYLYMASMKNMETQLPKETRILKHLLTIKDPEELISNLNDAFTPPGPSESNRNLLCTTPEELFTSIQRIVDAYNFSRQGTLLDEAKDLMNPQLIARLEELKKLIKDKFM